MTTQEEREQDLISYTRLAEILAGDRTPRRTERGPGARMLLRAFAPTYELTAAAIRILGLGAVSGSGRRAEPRPESLNREAG